MCVQDPHCIHLRQAALQRCSGGADLVWLAQSSVHMVSAPPGGDVSGRDRCGSIALSAISADTLQLFRDILLKLGALVSIVSRSPDARGIFLLAVFFRQVLVQVSNPDGKAPFRKITVLVLCTLTRAPLTWTQWSLCVWG